MPIDAIEGSAQVTCDNCESEGVIDVANDAGCIDDLQIWQVLDSTSSWILNHRRVICPNCQEDV